MRIGAVEAFGVDEQVVDLWQQTGVQELLPIQESALREHGALDGRKRLFCSNKFSFVQEEVQPDLGTFWFQAKSRR